MYFICIYNKYTYICISHIYRIQNIERFSESHCRVNKKSACCTYAKYNFRTWKGARRNVASCRGDLNSTVV